MKKTILLLLLLLTYSHATEYSTHPIAASNVPPENIQVVDMDMDGDGDLFESHPLAWHEYLGDQTFIKHAIEPPTNTYRAIVTDIDLDGDMDIIANERADRHPGTYNKLVWFENRGDMTFSKHTIADSIGIWFSLPQAIDFDDDGDTDILVAENSAPTLNHPRAFWFENRGNGSFLKHDWNPVNNYIINLAVSETSENNEPDIFVSSGEGLLRIRLDHGVVSRIDTIAYPFNAHQNIFTGDIDNDGDTDVFTSPIFYEDPDSFICWFENLADTSFFQHDINTGLVAGYHIAIEDVDADGTLDLICSGNPGERYNRFNVIALLNDGGQGFTAQPVFNNLLLGNSTLPFDIDSDGDADLFTNDIDLTWYENHGDMLFERHFQQHALFSSVDLKMSDFDNNNDLDLVVCSARSTRISLFWNDGGWRFQGQTIYESASESSDWRVTTGDYDNNGLIDIVSLEWIIETWTGSILLHSQVMPGHFETTFVDSVSEWDWRSPSSHDMDNDGDLDILSSYPAGYYQNMGAGVFDFVLLNDSSMGTRAIDYNLDGNIDLLTRSATQDQLTHIDYHENNGAGEFTTFELFTVPDGYRFDVFDLDNDADLDFLTSTSNIFTGGMATLNWVENLGGNQFEIHAVDSSLDNIWDVHILDYDGDGDYDFYAEFDYDQRLGGAITWYSNSGDQFFDKQVDSLGLNHTLALIDIDEDGDADLAAQFNSQLVLYENLSVRSLNQESFQLPEKSLLACHPNPFNPSTTIKYQLTTAASVKLILYDTLGSEILTLVDALEAPGTHAVQWNGMAKSGKRVSSGMYFAQLQSGDRTQTIKMVYLR